MRKNDSAAIVQRAVEMYGGDEKKLAAELKRLVKEGRRDGDLVRVGAAYCNLAELCHAAADEQGAFSNALRAVACLKDTDAHELLARAYVSLGLVYTNEDNPQMAMEMDETAYQLVRKHRIRGRTRINVLNSLSANYNMLGDVPKGIRLLTKCLSLVEASPEEDLTSRARYSLNLAHYYRDNQEPEKARELLASMAPWIERVDYRAVVCDYYLRCAILSYQLDDPRQGDGFADTAFATLPNESLPAPVYVDLQDLSQFLLARRDRARADRILEMMTALAETNKGTVQQIFAHRIMAKHYRVFGETERAAACYERLVELLDAQKREMRQTQLKQLQRMKASDSVIRSLKREMLRNDEMASLEPMTGLLNRSALLRVSSEFIESAARKGQKVGAVFIDIDFFKECNDTYGHARGDEIIRRVADACRKEDAKNVRFARYGGDEFFGITRGLTDDAVCDIARRIAGTIRDEALPQAGNPNGGRITLSIGVVNMEITHSTNTILDIVNNADKALYCAKGSGKNAICQQVLGDADADGSRVSFVRINF